MSNYIKSLLYVPVVLTLPLQAQVDTQLHADYAISTEMAIGSGDYTAYQLVANRHDVLSHQSNTGYMRAAIGLSKQLTADWQLTGGADLLVSAHAKQPAYVQQCYANASWKGFYIEAGSREHHPVLRNALLSSGSLVYSGNARPIPGLRLGTEDFLPVPGTNQRLLVYLDGSYGYCLDGNWLTDRFATYHAQKDYSFVTSDVWLHQKQFFLRSVLSRQLSFTLGMEHAVQFGGTKQNYNGGVYEKTISSPSVVDFLHVLFPQSDGAATTESGDGFVYGNHVGSWTLQFDWKPDASRMFSAYLENPFEDGSGLRKGNQWDGLWGLEYRDRSEGTRLVRGVVIEYLRMLDQSGPIHWAPADFVPLQGSKFPTEATGNDNCYNNFNYNGFAYYGQALGTGLLKSPIYNSDGFLCFTDSRVSAWHMAVTGDIASSLDYLVRGSYREGYGTYFVPLAHRSHSFDMMAQCCYRQGAWRYALAVGLTQGNIYGDCTTFDFKVTYHGKIL